MGKGDTRRPSKIDRKTFEDNWDKVFNKKPEPIKVEPNLIKRSKNDNKTS